MKVVAQNKKAFFDYEVLDRIEAGIVLTGDEVKSLRAGHVSLAGSFATVHDGQLYLINCHITPYARSFRPIDEQQASRRRGLLLHRKELDRLIGDVSRKGITLVPLRMYFNERNKAKVEIGICKHKKAHQRKEELRERDIKRQTRAELKYSNKD